MKQLWFLGLAVLIGCNDTAEEAAAPATVDHAVTEAQLTTVTLSAEAFERLGIETVVVESTTVAPTRTVGGEVIIPSGQSLTVSAPVAGTVLPPERGDLPRPGSRVVGRQPLLRLVALPPDRDLLRVQQEQTIADAVYRQAQAEADRVARLYADKLVSAREHERAQAELISARAAVEAATARQNMVRGAATGDVRNLSPLLISAPDGGVVRALHAGAGQTVAAGAPLVEIMRIDRLWVRVPVYVGDANRIDRRAVANVHGLSSGTGPVLTALPVAAPPSADASASSVDLYYEVHGAAGFLRPGERVGVTLQIAAGEERALVVPLAAVLRDMNGGSWVYEQTDPLKFTRRRVDVARVVNGKAVLASGPRPGARVVTSGAAELFGTEFGIGK